MGLVDVGGILVYAWSDAGKEELERRERVGEENRQWVARLAPLVFGHYAWIEGEIAVAKRAGTGIFVAPRLGLSAAHVSRSYQQLDDQFDAIRRRMTVFDSKYKHRLVDNTRFSTQVYQLPPGYDRPGMATTPLMWPSPDAADSAVDVDLSSPDTDITTLRTHPISPGAGENEKLQRFFEWQMLPPPVGEQVFIFGLPGRVIMNHGERHTVGFWVKGDVARVVGVSPVVRDCGQCTFAGFTLDKEFDFGMSGAAVFYNDALVGIFSGTKYVASLWPLALHTYIDSKEDRSERQMADLFDSRQIHVRDWSDVKGKVERVPCGEAGTDEPCSKEHVVLRD
ncbi:MAG TPA: hypothetical protein VHL58_17835 [Thermoanaerobaculia bacterium]|nr:hypothetical protein [Thermoanaerobaculia bacterium]